MSDWFDDPPTWAPCVGWSEPTPGDPPPVPGDSILVAEAVVERPAWADLPECSCCGAFLGDTGDHADGSPRCTSLEYRGGIIVDNVAENLNGLQRGLDKLQSVVGEPEPKAKRRWFSGGGSGQVAKPPPFRRFGIR